MMMMVVEVTMMMSSPLSPTRLTAILRAMKNPPRVVSHVANQPFFNAL